MKKCDSLAVLCFLACLVVTPARATLLNYGTSVSPGAPLASVASSTVTDATCSTPTTGATMAPVDIVADTCVQTRNALIGSAQELTAQIRELVVRETGGTLDFLYQIAVTGTAVPGATITDMFTYGFADVTMNVFNFSNVELLGGGPGSDAASAVVSGSGGSSLPGCVGAGNGCISWLFGTPIGLSQMGLTELIRTNATSFSTGVIGFDTSGGGSVDRIVGFTATPEPMSIIMLSTVLGLGAFCIRRRHTTKNRFSVG